jgi:hypothetical protein
LFSAKTLREATVKTKFGSLCIHTGFRKGNFHSSFVKQLLEDIVQKNKKESNEEEHTGLKEKKKSLGSAK